MMKASTSQLARDPQETEFIVETPRTGNSTTTRPASTGERRPALREARAEPVAEQSVNRAPLSDPFGPDVILPEQFYDRQNGMEETHGEKALMLAVLEDGIRCFQEHLKNPRVRPRLLARQAEKWIRSTDWDWPFSFNNVCESLALNPECLRTRLLAPRENGDPAPKPRPSSHRVYRLTPRVKPPRRR